MDVFDYCELRKHLDDLHKPDSRRNDLCSRDLCAKRITDELVCTACYDKGYPVGMILTRSVDGIPRELQAVEVVGNGYKELQPLLSAALSHTHQRAGIPFNSDPGFFWPVEWTSEAGTQQFIE